MHKSFDKLEVVDALRKLAQKLNRPPTRNEFRGVSGISERYLLKHFSSFREALRASGLEPDSTNVKLDDKDLLEDWGLFIRQHRQIPTRNQYERKGKYSYATFENHFGTWSAVSVAFRRFAQDKPEWADVLQLIPAREPNLVSRNKNESRKTIHQPGPGVYVDPSRLKQLQIIKSEKFDLTKLIRLCEELNECYDDESFLAVTMLVRAILDHIPPIFECSSFAQIASSYGGNVKTFQSFKKSMEHLLNSSREISNRHLHSQIRSKETLPNKTQVNFANDLDVLLEEVVRILK